jgi:7,8-dihydro-6-hydroxymethylpterin dimethyltransferase
MSRLFNTSVHAAEGVSCAAADLVWHLARAGGGWLESYERLPIWAPGKLSSRPDATVLAQGVPRTTRSICPECVAQRRNGILEGTLADTCLKNDPGVISAEIVEEAGRILIRKICPVHGPFEDLLATSAEFFRRMERLCPGPDFLCSDDETVHDHGVSSIKYGRGAFLVFDLTNRCNMKCWPCFMDANAVGYVHELDLQAIKTILLRARSFKPQREVNILFSGGEPTMSPFFLDALACARNIGFRRLHVATNGIRFAREEGFAEEARQAGLHSVFLQFDGVSEEANQHRHVGDLYETKLRAMENLSKVGLRITLQSTLMNDCNEGQVGSILEFAVQNVEKVFSVVFQPIMFAGRDRRVGDDRRYRQRYTLSQLAQDLSSQTHNDWQPLRDWFPTAIASRFTNVLDLLNGETLEEGSVSPSEHPDWGIMSPLLVNRRNHSWVPITQFFDLESFAHDLRTMAQTKHTKRLLQLELAASVLRNYKPNRAPEGFSVMDLVDLFHQCSARMKILSANWESLERGAGDWTLFIVYGQWFQDAYLYDLKAIETSMTPVATQNGEIAFSAYNSIGWRDLVERQHKTATLLEWHRRHGRHQIYAHGDLVGISNLARANTSEREATEHYVERK